MRRVQQLFERRRRERRCALGTYVTAGDPDRHTSLSILQTLVQAGSDMIELGYPCSDPVWDGAIIRGAHRRALQQGMSLSRVLDLVADFRGSNHDTPVILMGYYGPILAMGAKSFARAAGQAGVDAVIVADLSIRLAQDDLLPALAAESICLIPLCTPHLRTEDLPLETPGIGGFLYCVAAFGPTGGPATSIDVIRAQVDYWRGRSSLPIGIGFGIKNAEFAAVVAGSADAVIIGTALVQRITDWLQAPDPEPAVLMERLEGFVWEVRNAIDHAREREAAVT